MKKTGFGLQLYSVRAALAKDEWDTVDKVAAMGYTQVELCAPDFVNGRPAPADAASASKKRYDDLGLRRLSIAMPLDFHPDIEDWKRLTAYSNEVGCEGICCSVATFRDREDVLRKADFFNAVAEYAAKNGQKFYYHNHYHEFQKLGGERVLDTLAKRTDPRYVDFELDTFWTLRGGVDPIAYMRTLGERLKLVHQKDLSADTQPVNLFERIGPDEVIDWDGFLKYAHNDAAFTELGRGVMNVRGIIDEARKMESVISVVIEQDATAIGELESAKVNYEYMAKIFASEAQA